MTRRRVCGGLGALVLLVVWVWPLPQLAAAPFTVHMASHMALVAVAAPLLALGVAGGRFDPVPRAPLAWSALLASMAELLLVWAWHAPALHRLARHELWASAAEQLSFVGAGLWLWLAALGGRTVQRRARAIEGVAGLLLTSVHMTLLGAIIALSPRPLYDHSQAGLVLTPAQDQQLGGAIMLLVGGVAYLAGALGLMAEVLTSASQGEGAT